MGWEKCSAFSVEVKGEAKKVIEEAAQKAKSEGLVIKGNEKGGSVTHDSIKGTYTIEGKKITFNLSESLFIGDCGDIKKAVSEYFKGK